MIDHIGLFISEHCRKESEQIVDEAYKINKLVINVVDERKTTILEIIHFERCHF